MEQDEQGAQDRVGFVLHILPILFDALLLSKPTSTAMEQDEQDMQDGAGFALHALPILFGEPAFTALALTPIRPTDRCVQADGPVRRSAAHPRTRS